MFSDPSFDKNINNSSDNEDAHENFSKSSNNLKQSNSFGNLTDSNRNLDNSFNIDSTTMKRNKSFWRFSKSEDILEGMALWKHRDLVTIDLDQQHENDQTLKKQEKPNKKMSTMQKKNSRMEEPSRKMDTLISDKRDRGHNMGSTYKELNKSSSNRNLMHHNDDDEIYDESPKRRNDIGPSKSHSQKTRHEKNKNNNGGGDKFSRELQDTNFYDDDVMVIKTVKRKEILKQYYSSGTDTELSSSDPYDCIVVDDHLVPTTSNFRGNRNSYAGGEHDKRGNVYSRSNKNETGTLLPRTKLSKSSRNDNETFEPNDRMNTLKSSKNSKQNNFGKGWSNLWPDE